MKNKIILLYSPEMQSGKSTVAEYLHTQHWYEIVSFANSVKEGAVEILRGLMPWSRAMDHIYKDKTKPIRELNGKTGREILQTLGTNWGRNIIDKEMWVKCSEKLIHSAFSQGKDVVVDDWRFLNEYEYLKENGYNVTTVKIQRFGLNNATSFKEHESENGIPKDFKFDHVIINDASKEVLFHKAEEIIFKMW